MRTLLGLPANTEVFPKQDIVPKGGTGNWINLPYFGGDNSPRHLLMADGNPITNVDIAVAEIIQHKITLEQFQAYIEAYQLLMNLFKSFSCGANLFVSYASQLASLYNKVKKLVKGSSGTDLPTILDDVTYADIFDTGENMEDKPKEQC